jgi:hypothetical protein
LLKDILTFPPVWLFAVPAALCWVISSHQAHAEVPPKWDVAVTEDFENLKQYLKEGWEPFAGSETTYHKTYFLRRRAR